MFDCLNVQPCYRFKSGCITWLLYCYALFPATLNILRALWVRVLAKNSIKMHLLALHLPKSCTEAICDRLCEKGSYNFSKLSTLLNHMYLKFLSYQLHITPINNAMLGPSFKVYQIHKSSYWFPNMCYWDQLYDPFLQSLAWSRQGLHTAEAYNNSMCIYSR